MTGAALSLAETAAAVHLSRSRFYAVWPRLVEHEGMPAPFLRPPVSDYAWDAQAIAAWKEARSRALPTQAPAPRRAIAPSTPVDPAANLARQRNELARMMKGA